MKVFQFAALNSPRIVHAVATKAYGNMSFLYGQQEAVRDNRTIFLRDLGIDPKKAVVADLSHGDVIAPVSTDSWGNGLLDPASAVKADTLITDEPDVYLFMFVADCLALFYFDQVRKVIALSHAGWRGVTLKVPQKVVTYMVEHYQSKPEDIVVGFSPSIQRESSCFDQLDQKANPIWQPYIRSIEVNGGTKFCTDVAGFAYDQLIQVGINPGHIERSLVDTKTDPNFFSHRRSVEEDLPEERFGCVIGLTTKQK